MRNLWNCLSSRKNQGYVRTDNEEQFTDYGNWNFNDFDRHKHIVSTATDYIAVDESDVIHRVMIEVEPLREASGKNLKKHYVDT